MQKQNAKDIKLFGLSFAIILSLISIKLFKSGKLFYKNTIGIAVIFFVLSIFLPKVILPIYKIFRLFAYIVNWLISNIALILIFYLVFTPIGLFLRLIGKDLLDLEKSAEESQWIKKPEVFLKDRYIKQF